jgi:hypothetical protein
MNSSSRTTRRPKGQAAAKRSILAAAATVLGAAAALAADRAKAVIDCKATGEALVYDCTIKLANARTAAALEQATVTVGAAMPSMPMAHNVAPVAAKAGAEPGEYRARLALEMYGDWALRLRIEGPLKDQLVEVKRFDEKGAGPPRRKGPTPPGHAQ